jgi:DNA (cytosine-5)-methyltransferase 1
MTALAAYYNELDPYPAQWLRNLITAGHIAPGVVDQRDIREVKPNDIGNAIQAHFFAGIGVWSHALRLAGWPDDRPVWTGSCPCQPWSVAGKRGGADDPRHLWPEWFRLIRECRPPIIFGEQVASKDGLAWLDLVYTDLEGEGYAVAAVDLCAAGVGAPHKRQRLYFVAVASSVNVGLAIRGQQEGTKNLDAIRDRKAGDLEELPGAQQQHERRAAKQSDGAWSDIEWLQCADGKKRPTQPGLFPLAHGSPSRMGRLRAYGNAIVAPLAAEFIRAWMDVNTGAEAMKG